MINNVTLMGRLTYEPELRTTPNGLSLIHFQLAVDRDYVAKGEERKADFIDCTAWRATAEFISRNFHKGEMLALTGTLQTENYTDKQGNKRKDVSVSVSTVSFCGSKTNTEGSANIDGTDIEEIDDDMPF